MSPKPNTISERTILTRREQEIYSWVIEGLSAKEISDVLKIRIGTVYTHRKNILRKNRLSSERVVRPFR